MVFSLVSLVVKGVLFLHSNLEYTIGYDRVSKFVIGSITSTVRKMSDFGPKEGKGFGKRAAHPTQFFWTDAPSPHSKYSGKEQVV